MQPSNSTRPAYSHTQHATNVWCRELVLNMLTFQELKILKLVATDLTNKEIADQLFISTQTVKKHRQNIYKKLELCGKFEIRKFLRWVIADLYG